MSKPNGKSILTSTADLDDSRNDSSHRQSATAKSIVNVPVFSANNLEVMMFNDISLGPHESELQFRVIHFWEARVPLKNTLIGLEMLLIDAHGTVIQGFIAPGRIKKFLPHLKQGSVYSLLNFYGGNSKAVYRVAAHSVNVCFSHTSELTDFRTVLWFLRRTVSTSIPTRTSKLGATPKVISSVSTNVVHIVFMFGITFVAYFV